MKYFKVLFEDFKLVSCQEVPTLPSDKKSHYVVDSGQLRQAYMSGQDMREVLIKATGLINGISQSLNSFGIDISNEY